MKKHKVSPFNRPVILILAVACVVYAGGWMHSMSVSCAKDNRISALESRLEASQREFLYYQDAFLHLVQNTPQDASPCDCGALQEEILRLKSLISPPAPYSPIPPAVPMAQKKGCLHLF